MEANHVDPYAPPKAALTGTDNTTYLDQDGYAFNSELVANQHFKSPLICAKLGIPIPPESNLQPKNITITRVPRISKSIFAAITLVSFALLMVYCFFNRLSNIVPAIVFYLIATSIFKRLITKPYQIPFYLSVKYTRIRFRRNLTYTTIFLLLIAISTIGFVIDISEYTTLAIPAAILTLIIFKFKTTYFVVTQTKGEFHYIRGAHRNLLDALPYLPISP